MEEDENDQGQSCRGGWQAGSPIGDAELLKKTHRAPVVQGGLLEPGFSIKDGGDCAASDAVEGVADVFQTKATGNHLGVDIVAGSRVRGKHLSGDLSVSGLVCSYQAELVAAKDRYESVKQKKNGDYEKDDEFPDRGDRGQFEILLKPLHGCATIPCAGDGGMLNIVHFPMRNETRLSESCPQLGEDSLKSDR